MKRTLTTLIAAALLLALTACDMLGYHIPLSNNYALFKVDGEIQLSYKDGEVYLGVVNLPVEAYVNHDGYIAVLTRGQSDKSAPLNELKKFGHYYVVPLKQPVSDDFQQNVLGPLLQAKFIHIVGELGYKPPKEITILPFWQRW